jgi:RNA polymerase sigma-70 factor (ECF subfamily)
MKQQTFDNLLLEHRDRIYSHALYCLRDPDDAADVTQEVFVRLWQRFDDIDQAKAPGWLSRVVHNLCIDQTRRRKAQRTHFGQPDNEAVDRLHAPRDGRNDPEHRIHLDQRQTALLDAMATLTPETRSVMVMHYFQGLKLPEIAEQLDKTVSALKVQIHRARKSLRLVLTAAAEAPPNARQETG